MLTQSKFARHNLLVNNGKMVNRKANNPMVSVVPHYYDIAILPSPEVRDYAITLSKKVAENVPTRFVLGRFSYRPHISLYHVAIAPSKMIEVKKRLSLIAMNTVVDVLTCETVTVFKPSALGMIRINSANWLKKLHDHILSAINPLRDRRFDVKAVWGYEKLTTALKQNVKQYGSPVVRKQFDPHISLAFLKDREGDTAIFKKLKLKHCSFTPHHLSVCAIALPGHSCQKELYRFSFK